MSIDMNARRLAGRLAASSDPLDMNEPAEPLSDLRHEAMTLLIAWQEKPHDPAARDVVREWCARSPRHLAAWENAKRVWQLTGVATGATQPPEPRRAAVGRRAVLGGLGVAALGAAAAWRGPGLWQRWQADITTGVAQIQRSELPDGSLMTLGPFSAVRLDFTPAARTVDLLEGLAFFEVRDEPRPFRAISGDFGATARAGSFELRGSTGQNFVGVDRGEIRIAGAAGLDPFLLEAGEWIAVGPGNRIARGRREANQIAAWRNGVLMADKDPVSSVVAEIARWQSAQVVIPQQSLANAQVSGVFDLRDPNAALEAVLAPFGGRIRHVTPWLLVLTTI